MQGLPFRAGLMAALRLCLVGLGTIARKQHLGAIGAMPGITLAAAASHGDTLPGLPGFASLDAMLASNVAIDAMALCTPPRGRLLQDGTVLTEGADAESAGIDSHFAELAARGETDLDLAPLTLVADAFLLGRRHTVEPFLEG